MCKICNPIKRITDIEYTYGWICWFTGGMTKWQNGGIVTVCGRKNGQWKKWNEISLCSIIEPQWMRNVEPMNEYKITVHNKLMILNLNPESTLWTIIKMNSFAGFYFYDSISIGLHFMSLNQIECMKKDCVYHCEWHIHSVLPLELWLPNAQFMYLLFFSSYSSLR